MSPKSWLLSRNNWEMFVILPRCFGMEPISVLLLRSKSLPNPLILVSSHYLSHTHGKQGCLSVWKNTKLIQGLKIDPLFQIAVFFLGASVCSTKLNFGNLQNEQAKGCKCPQGFKGDGIMAQCYLRVGLWGIIMVSSFRVCWHRGILKAKHLSFRVCRRRGTLKA